MHPDLEHLIKLTARLPGIGPRSARRMVLEMIKKREKLLQPLTLALKKVDENITTCETCGNLDGASPCHICTDERRDVSALCVVEDVADLWAMERAQLFKGRYHVLGGTLSALDGVGPEKLNVAGMIERASDENITEVILATNATMEGQTTAHYLTERLENANVKITRLAQGIPVGGELDYLDDGTLGTALKSRLPF